MDLVFCSFGKFMSRTPSLCANLARIPNRNRFALGSLPSPLPSILPNPPHLFNLTLKILPRDQIRDIVIIILILLPTSILLLQTLIAFG